MRTVLLSLRHFQEMIQRQSLLIATDNTTVVAYLQNQGGTHSFSLYLLYREMLLLCDSLQTVLTVRHVPEYNSGCIISIPCSSEYGMGVTSSNFSSYHSDMGSPPDRSVCHQFELQTGDICLPIPDQKAWTVDAMTISWKGVFNYIFSLFRLLHKILHKIREDGCKTILIAPAWPRKSWFPDLLLLSCAKPLLPLRGDLLSQFKGKKLHQGLEKLHLHAWLLSGRQSDRKSNQAHLWSS